MRQPHPVESAQHPQQEIKGIAFNPVTAGPGIDHLEAERLITWLQPAGDRVVIDQIAPGDLEPFRALRYVVGFCGAAGGQVCGGRIITFSQPFQPGAMGAGRGQFIRQRRA